MFSIPLQRTTSAVRTCRTLALKHGMTLWHIWQDSIIVTTSTGQSCRSHLEIRLGTIIPIEQYQTMDSAIFSHYHHNIQSVEEANACLPELLNVMRRCIAAECWKVISKHGLGHDRAQQEQLLERICKDVEFTPVQPELLGSKATGNDEGSRPQRALYDLESHKIQFVSETGSHWPELRYDLAEQLARAAVYALHKVDACAAACSCSSSLELHTKLAHRLRCSLQQFASLEHKEFDKAPDTVDADHITQVCHECGRRSTSFVQFLCLVTVKLMGKVQVLDLIEVLPLRTHHDNEVQGAGLAGAEDIFHHMQQPNSILAFKIDLLRNWLPMKFVTAELQTSHNPQEEEEHTLPCNRAVQVDTAGKLMMTLFMALVYCAKDALKLGSPPPEPLDSGIHHLGDPNGFLIWLHEGLVVYDVKASFALPGPGDLIRARLSTGQYRFGSSKQQHYLLMKVFNVPVPEDAGDDGHALPGKTVAVIVRGPTINPHIQWENKAGNADDETKAAYTTKIGVLLQ